MKRTGPYLPNIEEMAASGLLTRGKCVTSTGKDLKIETRRFLRIIDEQRAVNRYKWFNLPVELSSQELERLLYYKGHLAFFYSKDLEKFLILPYALDGTIDYYGRYNTIHPVPIASGIEGEEKEAEFTRKTKALQLLKLTVRKDLVVYEDEITEDLLENSAVILRDYTNQLQQTNLPRWQLNDQLIDIEADCIPFLRTSLLLGTGVRGMRVGDADSESEVTRAANLMYEAAISGNPYVPITASVEIQDLQGASALKSEEFMLAMQSIDNLLLAGYGIDNGGLFEKKAHILETEAQINASPVKLALQDGLNCRQNFCNIVNSIWDIGIWCELSDTLTNMDSDANGTPYDDDTEANQPGGDGSTENAGGDAE